MGLAAALATEPTIDFERARSATWATGDLMWMAVFVAAGLLVLFVALATVRYWSQKLTRERAAGGTIDLDRLRADYEAGLITEDEFRTVRDHLLGLMPARTGEPAEPDAAEAPHGDVSIQDPDETGPTPDGPETERTQDDGEA